MKMGDMEGGGMPEEHIPTNMQQLTETVMTAARSSMQRARRYSPSLSKLKLDNMKMHGREDDIKLLKRKLRDNIIEGAGRRELVLIAGVSG